MIPGNKQLSPEQQAALRSYRPLEALIPAHWSQGRLAANGIQQYYYRSGGANPPLILLHGIMVSGITWLRVAMALQDDYDVILLDARGHGRSEGIATGFTPELLAHDVQEALTALNLQKPSLLGHSMGAATAAMVAAARPDLIHALVLEDPPWHTAPHMRQQLANSDGYQQWFHSWLAWLEQFQTLPRAEQLVSLIGQLPPGAISWPEDELVPWADAYAHLDLNLARSGMALWGQLQPSAQELLPRITCPTLLITGNPSRGAVVAPEDIEEMKRANPAIQVANVENAGHMIHTDAFETFITLVKDFLSDGKGSRT